MHAFFPHFVAGMNRGKKWRNSKFQVLTSSIRCFQFSITAKEFLGYLIKFHIFLLIEELCRCTKMKSYSRLV